MYLRQPAIAQLVVNSMQRGVQLAYYDLHAYVVMANHVHLLILPKIHPSRLLQSLNNTPEEFPWSSAGVEKNLDAARTSACATLSWPRATADDFVSLLGHG